MERCQTLDARSQEQLLEEQQKWRVEELSAIPPVPAHFGEDIHQLLRKSRAAHLDAEASLGFEEVGSQVVRERDPFKLLGKKEDELQEVRAQLEEALASQERYYDDWKQATYELNVLQTDRIYKTDDDFFIGAWNELRYEIKNWAIQHFDDSIKFSIRERPRSPSRQLTDRVDNFHAYMNSNKLRPSLIQAFVWFKLERDVFDSECELGPLWAGFDFYRLKNMRRILEPASLVPDDQTSPSTLKEYHKWRALTSRLTDERTLPQEVEKRQRRIVQSIVKVLGPFSSSSDETFNNGFISGIWKIVANATRLDAEFHKQLAVFTVYIPRGSKTGSAHGYIPNLETFEDESRMPLDPRRPVALVVVPALRKRGNADGLCYENDIVLVKSCAIQEEPTNRLQKKLRAPYNAADVHSNPSKLPPNTKQTIDHDSQIPRLHRREEVRRSTSRKLQDMIPTFSFMGY